jgi:hypothetical protein
MASCTTASHWHGVPQDMQVSVLGETKLAKPTIKPCACWRPHRQLLLIGFTAQRPEDELRKYGHSSGAFDDGEGAAGTGDEGEDDVRFGELSGAAAEEKEVELLATGSSSPWTPGNAVDEAEPEEEEEEEEEQEEEEQGERSARRTLLSATHASGWST